MGHFIIGVLRETSTIYVVAKGKFDHPAILSKNYLKEIDWWSINVATSIKHINIPAIDITIYTDASLKGWALLMGVIHQVEGGQITKCNIIMC